jgi:hypothetical protein
MKWALPRYYGRQFTTAHADATNDYGKRDNFEDAGRGRYSRAILLQDLHIRAIGVIRGKNNFLAVLGAIGSNGCTLPEAF